MQPLYEYVCHMKGHRNSKGELAEWVIKSHETGEILSSHKSEKKAKEHLQQMHIFQEAADGGQPEDFHTLINRYATATASIINKFLEKYELSIEVVDTEEGKDFFEKKGAIAVRLASLQDDVHVAPVAINEELISRYYYDEWDEDNTILNECVSDTLWHEACHHICLYISDMLDVDIMDNDSEEDIVENYALYMTSKTMGIHKEFSEELVDKFSGAFAILNAINNGAFDKESLKEMMKFLYPSVDSENDLVEILEDIGLTESYKLIGESTYGTDMDKRIKIFMEGVNQLGLSSRQVDAIGKLTNACMESALDDSTDEGLADSELLVYTPENDAEFFKEAFKRAAIKVQDTFPDRLYEDEVPEKGLVLVDKKSGNRFSLVLRKGPADPIHFDPNCHGIEVRIGSDRKEYPLWLRKSKSIDELIDLMFDCIAQEVRYASDDEELPYNHTGRGKKVHMEGVDMDGEPKDGPDSTDKFVIEAFYRAVSRLLVKYPNQLYEDEIAGVIGDKITGKKFSIDFDPRCYMIEVRTKDDRKTYPLWVNKSKPMNLLIELIMDIFSEELETTDNTTYDADADEGVDYGRHVRTSEDEYDPENPEDPDDDIFYDGNGRVNELDPDEEPANF